jgi:hypothetical protein
MERSDGDVLSAEVVLRGVPGDDVSPISSANLSSREPAPESAAKVRDWFARHGFMTSDVHGVSITVTGPRGLFEEVCGTALSGPHERPGADVLDLPLPIDMPGDLAGNIEVITFTPPPDFGPGAY